ncbi:MAG: NifB/NifX family molybdenum-iron cluster-binding protein [Anaerovoracaceae bacterium]
MNIAIPTERKNIDTEVCASFGRTPYFLIYDTETKSGTFIDNSAIASTGGAGIKAAQSIVDNNVEVLLTPRCGENAAQVLNAAGIKIYKTKKGLAMENIDAFISGNLSLLDEIHPGFHDHEGV